MRRFLVFISLLLTTLTALAQAPTATAETLMPTASQPTRRYSINVSMQKTNISGIFILHADTEDGTASAADADVNASIFNEFGVSACDFTYLPKKDKVKVRHLTLPGMGALKRSVAKKYVRRGLLALIHLMQQGQTSYTNADRHVEVTLAPINQ